MGINFKIANTLFRVSFAVFVHASVGETGVNLVRGGSWSKANFSKLNKAITTT